jgi:Fe2+ transport system protein B
MTHQRQHSIQQLNRILALLTLLVANIHSQRRFAVTALSLPRPCVAASTGRTMTALSNNNHYNSRNRSPIYCVTFSTELKSSLKNDEEAKLSERYTENINNDWLTVVATQEQRLKETVESLPSVVELDESHKKRVENWVDESKHVELFGLIVWMVSISAFIFINNFVGPFPDFFRNVHERVFFLGHMIGGMLFGGECR